MTWAEICADPVLAELPNRIETDRWGRIVMSPPPRSCHGEYQLVAPEICVEVRSPSDLTAELEERKRLFFEKGAREFWLCDLDGTMSFFDPAGQIAGSELCPRFPRQVRLD